MLAAIGIIANYLSLNYGVPFGIVLFVFGLLCGIYAWIRGDIITIDEMENEKLKQRLEHILEEFITIKQNLKSDIAKSTISDMASRYIIQRWLDEAKISQDSQIAYFSDYIYYDGEFDLVRDCYVLLYIEDWISDTHLDLFYRNTRDFFKGGIEEMCKATNVKTDVKVTTSAITVNNEKLFGSKSFEYFFRYYSLEDALAKVGEGRLDPTDIVKRTQKALLSVKEYLK